MPTVFPRLTGKRHVINNLVFNNAMLFPLTDTLIIKDYFKGIFLSVSMFVSYALFSTAPKVQHPAVYHFLNCLKIN